MAADVAQYIGQSPITTAINSAQSMGNYLSTMAMNAIQRQYMPALMAAQTGQKQAQAFMQQQHGNLFGTQNQWTPYTDAAKIGLQNSQQNLNTNYLPQLDQAKTAQAVLTAQYIPQRANAYTQMANNAGVRNRISAFNTVGKDRQNQMISQAVAMGYDANDAAKLYINGNTVQDLANAKGIKTIPNPSYAPTTSNITTQQLATKGAAGVNALNQFSIKAGTPYGGAYDKAVHQWWWDATSNDPKRQATASNFYANQILTNEKALAAMRAAGARGGIGAMEEMQRQYLGKMQADPSFAPAPIRHQVYAIVNKQLDNMINTEGKQLTSKNNFSVNMPKTTTSSKTYSDSDIAFTAKKYGKSVAQVKQMLGVK